jgi:hypothetical protein
MITKICPICGKEFYTIPSRIKDGRGKCCSKECVNEYKKVKKIKCICKQCGKEFEVLPCKINQSGDQFCSHECSEKYHTGKNHSNFKERIKCICKQCGKEFEIIPSLIKNRNIFCSKECANEHRIKQIKCICKQCGKEFFTNPSSIKRGGGIFCSHECFWKYHTGKNHSNFKEKIKCICKKCGKEFLIYPSRLNRGATFCSKECSRADDIKRICKQCGKEFLIKSYHLKREEIRGIGIFCSKECKYKWASENLIGENSPCWNGGTHAYPYASEFLYSGVREATSDIDNYECQKCHKQIIDDDDLIPHHFDYNKWATGHKINPFNLILLCNSCNCIVNGDRKKWKQFFKDLRNKQCNEDPVFKERYENEIMYRSEGTSMIKINWFGRFGQKIIESICGGKKKISLMKHEDINRDEWSKNKGLYGHTIPPYYEVFIAPQDHVAN